MTSKTELSDLPSSGTVTRRNLLAGTAIAVSALAAGVSATSVQPARAQAGGAKPNILVIFGDDIGYGTSAPTTAA